MKLVIVFIMPPWLVQLRSALRKESRFNSSSWIQLATIGTDNTPRVRTVVFRGWSDPMKCKYILTKEVRNLMSWG